MNYLLLLWILQLSGILNELSGILNEFFIPLLQNFTVSSSTENLYDDSVDCCIRYIFCSNYDINPFQSSVKFQIETSHLFCSAFIFCHKVALDV